MLELKVLFSIQYSLTPKIEILSLFQYNIHQPQLRILFAVQYSLMSKSRVLRYHRICRDMHDVECWICLPRNGKKEGLSLIIKL